MRYALFVLAAITFFSMAVLASPSRRVMANLPRSTEFPESTKRQTSRSDVIANMRKRALEAKKSKRAMVPPTEEKREVRLLSRVDGGG